MDSPRKIAGKNSGNQLLKHPQGITEAVQYIVINPQPLYLHPNAHRYL